VPRWQGAAGTEPVVPSPSGAPPWRFLASGTACFPLRRCRRNLIARTPRGRVVMPDGRFPGPPESAVTSRGRRTPNPAPPSGTPLERGPSRARRRPYSMGPNCSQQICTLRSRKNRPSVRAGNLRRLSEPLDQNASNVARMQRSGMRGASHRRSRSAGRWNRSDNWSYAALSASNRRMTSGPRSMANNSARAGASGVLRCCSQSRKVVMGRWNASANSTWVIPRRCRSTFTRDTRRILASCSRVRGCASGSDSAEAVTSSSVIASIRAQSVLSLGRLSRE
jgi:hypothetical protein